VDDCIGPTVQAAVRSLAAGEVLLLQNLRYHKGEEADDPAFAAEIAGLGELYVNDAFGTAHRKHASVYGVPARMPAGSRALGFLFERELQFLGRAVGSPAHPFVAVLGGAKVSDKIGVVENLSLNCDVILVGGAMAYTFLAARGDQVGDSRVEREIKKKDKKTGQTVVQNGVEIAGRLMKLCEERQCTLLLPPDHRVGDAAAAKARFQAQDANVPTAELPPIPPPRTVMGAIPAGSCGLDIGPETELLYREIVVEAKMVVWNGPMGVFEWEPYSAGSRTVADACAKNAAQGGLAIVGGGDSAAAVEKFGKAARMSWVSTGGGASLEFLEGRPFPALEVIDEK
jgi:phosphoglycerate kinase